MGLIDRSLRLFETWVDPFKRADKLRPPGDIAGFFLHYLTQAKGPFVLMLVMGGLSALTETAFFFYIGRLVDILDSSRQGEGWEGLWANHSGELAAMLFVILFARIVVATLQTLIEEQTISLGFYNLVRWQSYLHVVRQSLSFFNNDFSGRVVTKVWQAGGALGDFLTGMLQVVWTIAIFTFTTLALFGQLDWRLAAIVGVWVALFAVLARYFVPRMRALAKANAEASSSLNGRLVDSYANIQTLKLFGTAEANDSYVREGYDSFLSSFRRFARTLLGVRTSMMVLSSTMITAIGVLSVYLWMSDLITVGAVAFTLALAMRLNNLLGQLMGQLNGLMRNFGTVQNSMEMIARPIEVEDAPDAKPFVPGAGRITFDNVSFHYEKGSDVIEDFSLTVRPGEKVGLVGRSGVGKSTIVSLLLRFYDPQSGTVSIDGQDVKTVTQDSLRAAIGVVTQDTSLLHRSVKDNIRYGKIDASDEEIVAAAKLAEADGFIRTLSDPDGRMGYEAHVGERGVKLSGGQRQRIAIARVLLKNAPILVLDEATSALDSEAEAAIQEQLGILMAGKTVIAIAHRLSTIAAMDRLIVLDKGHIAEQGSHAELLGRNGLYATLWARQSGGFLETAAREEAAE